MLVKAQIEGERGEVFLIYLTDSPSRKTKQGTYRGLDSIAMTALLTLFSNDGFALPSPRSSKLHHRSKRNGKNRRIHRRETLGTGVHN